jgi:hypothetical protein
MSKKVNSSVLDRIAIVAFVVFCGLYDAFGLGGDYPSTRSFPKVSGGKPATNVLALAGNPRMCPFPKDAGAQYPEGMDALINIPNRVHGFFVNAEDVFFYAGSAADFTGFLMDYTKISAMEKHLLILHDGIGEAKSPWETKGRPCDWKLYGCLKSWLNVGKMVMAGTNSTAALQETGRDTNYVLEVHFWTGGHIPWNQVAVPPNVEVRKEK